MENETPTTTTPNFLQKAKQNFKKYYELTKERLLQFRAKYPRLSLALLITAAIGTLGALLLFFICLFSYLGVFGPLPTYADLRNIRNFNASEVYSEDGVLLGKYFVENRIKADFDEISPNIINALIATEDARYYKHQGIDFRAWMRVFFKSILLSNETSGGGSTISQQLAKNLYHRREYLLFSTLINKLKETFTARRLERIYSKEELLKLYLNTVPFSENTYGIKVASQRFFDKSPKDLAVEEAAVLVGMLKATTIYNPKRYPGRSKERRNTVLAQMVKYGYLDQIAVDTLSPKDIDMSRYSRESSSLGPATYFREHLRLELEDILSDLQKPDGSPYNLYTDGLKIHTSIDSRLQRLAEEAVSIQMSKIQKEFYQDWKRGLPWGNTKVIINAKKNSSRYKALKSKGLTEEQIDEVFNTPVQMQVFSWDGENHIKKREMSPLDSIKYYLTLLHAGFLATEPQTGLIRAWVGGIDYQHFQYDHVKSSRQVGSTFKPIVYAGALRNNMLPCEYTENDLTTYLEYDNWEPENSDGNYGGVYSMEGGLTHSVNCVTVGVMFRAGVDTVKQLSQEMGISTPVPEVPAIALGAVEASLYDMTRVYGTFANRGKRPEIHFLDSIVTNDGKAIIKFDRPNPEEFPQVLLKDYADMMIKMLESVVDSGTARRLKYEFGLRVDLAGKTGTTQNQSDGWFIGFTPKLLAGAWVGAEIPQVHFRTLRRGQGASTALPIWGEFMRKVYKEHPKYNTKEAKRERFTPPADSIADLMKCPPYLDEMPIYVEDWNPEIFWDHQLFDAYPELLEQDMQGEYINIKPRRRHESDQEYISRLVRHVERLREKRQRRIRRKEFWDGIFFRNRDRQRN